MNDLIKREDAIAEICKARTPDVASHQYAELFINAVCRAPSVDRPRGEWVNVKISISGDSSAECSLCGAVVHNNFSNVISFCPNCGADMRGEDDETD